MKIDVKEIYKISLKENELLWVTVDEETNSTQDIEDIADNIESIVPKDWKKRIVVSTDKIHLTKIVKEG